MFLYSSIVYDLFNFFFFFFFNDTATTEIYTLSLHDALPISRHSGDRIGDRPVSNDVRCAFAVVGGTNQDRKSTRLNSSHEWISYAVFCLKKKKNLGICFVDVELDEASGVD